jgi:hypothetical protein
MYIYISFCAHKGMHAYACCLNLQGAHTYSRIHVTAVDNHTRTPTHNHSTPRARVSHWILSSCFLIVVVLQLARQRSCSASASSCTSTSIMCFSLHVNEHQARFSCALTSLGRTQAQEQYRRRQEMAAERARKVDRLAMFGGKDAWQQNPDKFILEVAGISKGSYVHVADERASLGL